MVCEANTPDEYMSLPPQSRKRAVERLREAVKENRPAPKSRYCR